MICISVAPTSRKLAKVDLLNAAPRCDMIELCLDHLKKEPDVGDLIGAVQKPILVSCRRQGDGGHWDGSEEDRIKLLRQAIVAGPAYVELELDVASSIPRFGETKRVVSYTSIDKPLSKVDDIFEAAWKAKADVVKFTWPTRTLDAAWPLLAAATKKRELPVVGMGLGKAGMTFSLLGQKFGCPWMYAALEKGMEAYPGQASVFDLDEVYGWRDIGTKTRFLGVCGFGFHSSDETLVRVLNDGFRLLDLDWRCLPMSLGKFDNLAKMLDIIKVQALLVAGQLGTVILDFSEKTEDAAQQAGVADLVLKQKDGWTAYNTLWRSALKATEATLGGGTSGERPLDRKSVLIIGAGGPARALAHGFSRRNGVVSITDPDDKAAREIAGQFNIRAVPFASVYDTLSDVAAITDPAIVVGHSKTDLNPAYLRPGMTVLDVTRLPEDTEFLREARERSAKIVEPRAIFLDQLGTQFKALTGKELPAEAIAGIAS